MTFVIKTGSMYIESEENIMETLDLKVLGYENDEDTNTNGTCYQGVIKNNLCTVSRDFW